MKKSHEIHMTRGPLLPELAQFILPLAVSSMLQITFNAADLIVVGRFGRPNAMAAVGSNGALVNLVVNVLLGLGVGAGVLCARWYGAEDRTKLRASASTALISGVAGGAVFALLGIALSRPLLRLMGSPPEVEPLAAAYLRIYFAGMPVIALYNFAGASLRAMGNTRQPLIYLSVAGVLNVLLNLFFVLVAGIDVEGVALATVLSQCVSCALTVRCLLRSLELRVPELRFSRSAFRQMVRIGLPAGIQGSLFSLSNFVLQGAVNSFGAAAVAGNAASVSLEMFLLCGQDAVSQAASTAVSQNVGARLPERTRQAVGLCLGLGVGITAVMTAGVWIFRETLVGLYTADPVARAVGCSRVLRVISFFAVNSVMGVMGGVLRGMGYSMLPTASILLGTCGLRILWVHTVFAAVPTLETLFTVYPVSWGITSLALLVSYLFLRNKPFSGD